MALVKVGQEYIKTQSIIVLGFTPKEIVVRNKRDIECKDVWKIPNETFRATYIEKMRDENE